MEEKLKIPYDISLTGFDNLYTSRLMSPQLTTVSQPISTMGKLASELLIKNIVEGSMPIKQSIVLPTELIIRESTMPPSK
jgi:LacI family transcriptional regulator